MSKKNIYVVRKEEHWATRTAGSSKPGKVYDTQKEAIDAGKEQAIRNNSELIIQGKDGKFREKNSYGSDPRQTKG